MIIELIRVRFITDRDVMMAHLRVGRKVGEREREKELSYPNYKKHDPKIHGNWTCLYLWATLTKRSKEAAG